SSPRRPPAFRSGTAVLTPGGTRLQHDNAAEPVERAVQPFPDPHRKPLARRVVEALDLIEVTMVEGVVQRCEGALDLGEVDHPTTVLTGRPLHVHRDAERVAVQARALVAGR